MQTKQFLKLLPLLYVGCVSSQLGTDFQLQNSIDILGTPKSRVIERYGTPYKKGERVSAGFGSEWYLYFFNKNIGTDENQHKGLTVEFINEKVHAFYFVSSFKDEDTNFDGEKVKQLQIGETTADQAIKMFGRPPGILNLPTHLIRYEMQIEPLRKGAKRCFRYEYALIRGNGATAHAKEKILTIYFNEAGVLVDLFYSNTF